MPIPESTELLKNNLKLQVELQLILITITHAYKALEEIKEKIKFMMRYFYNCMNLKCCNNIDKIDYSYDSLMNSIEYKKIILENTYRKLITFSDNNNIDLNLCDKNLGKCKKDPLFSKW